VLFAAVFISLGGDMGFVKGGTEPAVVGDEGNTAGWHQLFWTLSDKNLDIKNKIERLKNIKIKVR